jgi:hypothetical protein
VSARWKKRIAKTASKLSSGNGRRPASPRRKSTDRQLRRGGVREVEKAHREDGVEAVVRERQAPGVAAEEVDRPTGPPGLLAALCEHLGRDVEAHDVRAAFRERDREPTRAAGDLQYVLALDRC